MYLFPHVCIHAFSMNAGNRNIYAQAKRIISGVKFTHPPTQTLYTIPHHLQHALRSDHTHTYLGMEIVRNSSTLNMISLNNLGFLVPLLIILNLFLTKYIFTLKG